MNTTFQSHQRIVSQLTLFALNCLLLMMALGCSTPARNHVAVAIPNSSVLGQEIDKREQVLSLVQAGASGYNIYPVEVRIVIDDKMVTEIQALYAKEIDIGTVATAVNLDPRNHEIMDLRSALFRMWGNEKKHCLIQLREYGGEQIVQENGPVLHEGEKLLIVTQTHSKVRKSP